MGPQPSASETIVAIATAPGAGGIGIVRLSGPRAPEILAQHFRPARKPSEFESHRLYSGTFTDPSAPEVPVDEVLAVRMHAPHSYTGEEVAEIHGHGSPALLSRIVSLCVSAGARQARPGEFTERAFLSGRLDLAQAEAVADLIAARTERAQRQALEVLRGKLSEKVRDLADRLRRVLAHVEVGIDFTEEDVSAPDEAAQAEALHEIEAELGALLESYRQGRLLREGVRVALVGPPNAGKSSLFNALLSEERALVHEEPGTTRDRLEEWCEMDGIAVRLVDTAGLREAAGVEGAGVALAHRAMEEADLLLLVVDATAPLAPEAQEILEKEAGPRLVCLANKMDLPDALAPEGFFPTSAKTGAGLGEIRAALLVRLGAGVAESDSGVTLTRERHREAVASALAEASRAREMILRREGPELTASVLHSALGHLSEMAGETVADDILALIFSEFCIGK